MPSKIGQKKIPKELTKKQEIKWNIVIKHPNYTLPFDLWTDASEVGISAILTQKNNLVGIYSSKLIPSERNYTVCEKEMLAIIKGITHFKNIIYNSKINVKTDNRNNTFC
jgi:hypothetical protein